MNSNEYEVKTDTTLKNDDWDSYEKKEEESSEEWKATQYENVLNSSEPLCVDASSEDLKNYYNGQKIEEFTELNISTNLLRGIVANGFERPSPIQQKAILPFLDGRDIIAQAQSGTGKTATFLISVLQKVKEAEHSDDPSNNVQALIICHTQVLASQTYNILLKLSQYTKIKSLLCSGSEGFKDNTEVLSGEWKPQIIVGTPGRLLHILKENYISTRFISMMIIDEADVMMYEVSFSDNIRDIYYHCRKNSDMQIGMYTASISPEIESKMKGLLKTDNFVYIKVEQEKLTLDGIQQWYKYFVRPQEKENELINIFETGVLGQVVIYCNRKDQTERVARALKNEKISAVSFNSNMSMEEKKEVIKDFRSGKYRALVCTNILARGFDVQQISLVINFDFPISPTCENYLHRVGRSGRFGRKGFAISFITQNDRAAVEEVEDFYKIQLKELPEHYELK